MSKYIKTEDFQEKFQRLTNHKRPENKHIHIVPSNSELLSETFELATLRKLNDEMRNNYNLSSLLNMPAKELVQKYPQYRHLVREVSVDIEESTLFHLIISALGGEKHGFVSYFSMAGSKMVGFAAYKLEGTKVSTVKIFSFDPAQGSGMVLYRDMDRLFADFMANKNITEICWSAVRENPANKAYAKLNQKYGGEEPVEKGGIIYYNIKKNNFQTKD